MLSTFVGMGPGNTKYIKDAGHGFFSINRDKRQKSKPDGGYSDEKRQFFRVIDRIGKEFGLCIFSNGGRPDSRQNISRSSPPRAKVCTVTALVAEPYVRTFNQPVFKTPGCRNHFFSRERTVFRGNGTCNRTRRTLITFFKCFAAKASYLGNESQVRLCKIFFSHIMIPPNYFEK